jgi:hypothetical protein
MRIDDYPLRGCRLARAYRGSHTKSPALRGLLYGSEWCGMLEPEF